MAALSQKALGGREGGTEAAGQKPLEEKACKGRSVRGAPTRAPPGPPGVLVCLSSLHLLGREVPEKV